MKDQPDSAKAGDELSSRHCTIRVAGDRGGSVTCIYDNNVLSHILACALLAARECLGRAGSAESVVASAPDTLCTIV